ncbi:MAG: hypothetical protein MUO58_17840 [Anaerolineales bacterium]|jgi:hypothetical protein|nr:hypothetical protein [Anaerolineales bacterium]
MARKTNDSTTINQLGESRQTVGKVVEVYCDHNRDGSRVRDWLQGVVVQADEKLVAIQFTEDVYLTDGWMVPDRVLWTQHGSESIRPSKRKRAKRKS